MTYNPTCSRCWQPWTGLGSICNQCKIIEQQKLQVEQQQQALNQRAAQQNRSQSEAQLENYALRELLLAEARRNAPLKGWVEPPPPQLVYRNDDNVFGTLILFFIFFGCFFYGLFHYIFGIW